MARFKMVVQSECPDGVDENAFNDWYQNIHLAEVVKIPGFVAAERLEVCEHVSGSPIPQKYLAIYEIEAEDGMQAKQALLDASMGGEINMLENLNTSGFIATIYQSMGARVVELEDSAS